MNFSMNAQLGSYSSKENVLSSNKMEISQPQRVKQRTVLGVLSENEQHNRSHSQGGQLSKRGSLSDCSRTTFISCPSTISLDMCATEPVEVVVSASGRTTVAYDLLDEEAAALQHQDFRLFLELSANSCVDTSMHSLLDDDLTTQDVLCLSEYAEDIHLHLRQRELRFRPKPGYVRNHPELTDGMRVILVDWLAEVIQEYKLCGETLHLAVNYMDRFLSTTVSVKRGKLQLVGTAALLLASKYEEIYPPELDEFVYITDGTYTKKQLLRMESMFLRVLAFDMAVPTTHQFLRQFMTIHAVCSKTEHLALYVAELSLLELDTFIQHVPSVVAAAAYCMANYTLNRGFWPADLQDFSGYTMAELVPCLQKLHKIYFSAASRTQQAIRDKYKSSKYAGVSRITPPTALPFP